MNDTENREYIKQLQSYLYCVSLTDPSIPRVVPDGIYGTATRNAVAAYQRSRGRPVTGDADETTWESIKYDCELIRLKNLAPEPHHVFPGASYVVYRGEKSKTVSFIQLVLSALGSEYDFGGQIAVTGVYSERNAEAVEKLQTVHGIKKTGNVDLQTWNCIASDYALYNLMHE